MGKLRVGIIFGGRSAEHEISLLSARNVVEALDPEKYDVILI
jgi:D-alanine-D-alanine ligase